VLLSTPKHSFREVLILRIAPAHGLCFYPGSDKEALKTYKDNGYRQQFTEHLMQVALDAFKVPKCEYRVKRATSEKVLQAMSTKGRSTYCGKGWRGLSLYTSGR
jgi:hypothetical protein